MFGTVLSEYRRLQLEAEASYCSKLKVSEIENYHGGSRLLPTSTTIRILRDYVDFVNNSLLHYYRAVQYGMPSEFSRFYQRDALYCCEENVRMLFFLPSTPNDLSMVGRKISKECFSLVL